jgi:hypothetical protein
MRCLNSGVLACSSASLSFSTDGSSALIWRTFLVLLEQALVAAAENLGQEMRHA